MSRLAKTTLKRYLSATEGADPHGLTPYVALHLGRCDNIHVRRTCAIGYAETEGAPPASDPRWVYVNYDHLQDCLRVIDSEEVEVTVDATGHLSLKSALAAYETDLRVHTVEGSRAGFKLLDPGPSHIRIESDWLNGFNFKPFSPTAQPLLVRGYAVVPTLSGLLITGLSYDPKLPSHPRSSFLRAVSSMPMGKVDLTEAGFFRHSSDGMTLVTAGHALDLLDALRPLMVKSVGRVSLPGERTVNAMKSVASIANPSSPVQLSPRTGITARDGYGNPCRFGLGDVGAFSTINITNKTAQLVSDALGQVTGDVSFSRLGEASSNFRISRGASSVSFTALSEEISCPN